MGKVRIPFTRRLEATQRQRQIVELRDANVPFRTIAVQLKLSEAWCRQLHAQYYATRVTGERLTQAARKEERRVQLESLDALTMRYVGLTATPAAAAAAGLQPRDFVAFVEASRRIKLDLTRLDGLESPAADKAAGPRPDERPAAHDEGRAIAAFMAFVQEADPDLADRLAGVVAGAAGLDALGLPPHTPGAIPRVVQPGDKAQAVAPAASADEAIDGPLDGGFPGKAGAP